MKIRMLIQNRHLRLAVQAVCIVAVILILFYIPNVSGRFVIYLMSRIMFLSLIGMCFCVLMGFGGLASLTQAGIAGVAGYVLAIGVVDGGWPYWTGVAVSLAAVTLLSVVFSVFSMRTGGVSFMMMTMCLANLIHMMSLQWTDLTKGYNGVIGLKGPVIGGEEYSGTMQVYYLIAVAVPVCYFFIKRLTKSPYGKAIQGMRDNELKMNSIGFNTKVLRIVMFTITGFFTAIAGVLLATFYSSMAPQYATSNMSTMCLFMAIIGGVGYVEGAVVGTVLFVLLENKLSEISPEYFSAILGVIFLIFIFVLPNGLLGGPFWKKAFWKKIAETFKGNKKRV